MTCHLYTYARKCSPGDLCVTTATISCPGTSQASTKKVLLSRDSLDRGTDSLGETVRMCVMSTVHVLDTQAAMRNVLGRSLAAVEIPSTSLLI